MLGPTGIPRWRTASPRSVCDPPPPRSRCEGVSSAGLARFFLQNLTVRTVRVEPGETGDGRGNFGGRRRRERTPRVGLGRPLGCQAGSLAMREGQAGRAGGQAEPGVRPGLCWRQAAGGTSTRRKPVASGYSTWKLRRLLSIRVHGPRQR